MQQELSKMNSPAPPPRTSNRSTHNPKKTPDNPPFSRKVTNLYCWTHGGCAHESSKCNSKSTGHRNEATFENKLGASKGFCPWRCKTDDDKCRVTFLTSAIWLLQNVLTSSVVSPSSTTTVLPSPHVILAKGDSAASDHYFRLCDSSCLQNIQPTNSNPIILPDKTTIHATHTGELPFHSSFTPSGKTAKILPQLTSASLISIGKLCDNNCWVTFDKLHMCVYKNNQEIMRGIRNPTNGLWDIPIPTRKFSPPSPTQKNIYNTINLVTLYPSLAVIICKDTTKSSLTLYLHAACFSPVLSIWTTAINNNHFST